VDFKLDHTLSSIANHRLFVGATLQTTGYSLVADTRGIAIVRFTTAPASLAVVVIEYLVTPANVKFYTYTGVAGTPPKRQILDPWGVPYYYISHPDYLRGCKIWSMEGTNQTPVIFGATPLPDDFWGGSGDAGDAGTADPLNPRKNYYGPPPSIEAFHNANTFQLYSKGPDQLTDAEDADPVTIDACDRGGDRDDINNFGR